MKIVETDNPDILLPLLQEWHKEQNGKLMGIDMSIDKFVEDAKTWIKECGGVILVADDDKPVGFLMLITIPSEFGDQIWGIEKGWYVLPEVNGAAVRLYRAGERWCKDNGCSHFIMTASNLASDLHDKVAQFYEKMGMKKFETSFIKEI